MVIGPSAALPGLKERFGATGEVQSFSDAEALEALDHIVRAKPQIVALDHEFSRTSRGGALINRIKDDPLLQACEIRVVAAGADPTGVVSPASPSAPTATKAVLDQRGTRRAPRVRMREGVEVMADGNPASLVDLSRVGAQIVSKTVLKPNQRVRLVMGDGPGAVRCSGSIAWASFEMPKGQGTRYRAGVDFIVADADAVVAFAQQHRKN